MKQFTSLMRAWHGTESSSEQMGSLRQNLTCRSEYDGNGATAVDLDTGIDGEHRALIAASHGPERN